MSTKAAVHNMQLTVGNRITKAQIFEKKKAEKESINKAIKEGKRAAKLDTTQTQCVSDESGVTLCPMKLVHY